MGIQYTVSVSKTDSKNIKDWFEINKENILIVEELPKAKIFSAKEAFLGDSEALKIEYSGNPAVDTGYYTIKNGYSYAVEYTGTTSPYRQEHLDIFNQILSTFRFIEK